MGTNGTPTAASPVAVYVERQELPRLSRTEPVRRGNVMAAIRRAVRVIYQPSAVVFDHVGDGSSLIIGTRSGKFGHVLGAVAVSVTLSDGRTVSYRDWAQEHNPDRNGADA